MSAMKAPSPRDVLVELGFNAEWQAAWDDVYARVGFVRKPGMRPGDPEAERFRRRWSLVLMRPDHGGLPWQGWLRPAAEPATETPLYPCIDVRRVDGKVSVRILDASEEGSTER